MKKYTKLTHEDFIQIMNQVDNSLEILEEYKNTTQKNKNKMSSLWKYMVSSF